MGCVADPLSFGPLVVQGLKRAAGCPPPPPHPPPPGSPAAGRPCCRHGGHHRQQPLGKPTARLAVRPEAALAPQHRRPQGPLRHIVRRLHPSTRAKVHSAGHHFVSSRHSAAALRSGFSCPRRSSRPSRAWSGISRRRNSWRSNSPARKRSGSQEALRPPSPLRTVRDNLSSYGSSLGHLIAFSGVPLMMAPGMDHSAVSRSG